MLIQPWVKLHRDPSRKSCFLQQKIMKTQRRVPAGRVMALQHPCATRMLSDGEEGTSMMRGWPSQKAATVPLAHGEPRYIGVPVSLSAPGKSLSTPFCPGKLGCQAQAGVGPLSWTVGSNPPSRGTTAGMHLCLIPQLIYDNLYKNM